jgi:hypothetical protein
MSLLCANNNDLPHATECSLFGMIAGVAARWSILGSAAGGQLTPAANKVMLCYLVA